MEIIILMFLEIQLVFSEALFDITPRFEWNGRIISKLY